MRDVAFCLVENEKARCSSSSGRAAWRLVGRGEGSRHAAYRETREETGFIVKITHRLFTGNNNPIKVFVGQEWIDGAL